MPRDNGRGIRMDRLALVKAFVITMGNAFEITGIEKLNEV
jgi:arginyl-tRNA synthetase